MEHFEDLSAYFWTVCNLEFGFSPPVEGFSHCWPSCHKLGSLTVIQHPPRRVNVGENTRTHSCGEMWLRWGISWCGVAKHTHTHTHVQRGRGTIGTSQTSVPSSHAVLSHVHYFVLWLHIVLHVVCHHVHCEPRTSGVLHTRCVSYCSVLYVLLFGHVPFCPRGGRDHC